MKYYTADLHMCHTNIIKYENRPFNNTDEMNNYLIYKWNSKVKPNDEVYVLGDFAFCDGMTANNLLKQLNGTKYLIIGNHDSFLRDQAFDRHLFYWIKDYAKIKDNGRKVILFHYPIAVWDCQHHGSIHLYGHVHSNTADHHPLLFKLDNAYNVGVDVQDFEPKTLDEILSKPTK